MSAYRLPNYPGSPDTPDGHGGWVDHVCFLRARGTAKVEVEYWATSAVGSRVPVHGEPLEDAFGIDPLSRLFVAGAARIERILDEADEELHRMQREYVDAVCAVTGQEWWEVL